jgi:hypothetical protein
MPLYVIGIGDGLEPFSFAGVSPPLQFVWSISNKQVAQLKSAFYKVFSTFLFCLSNINTI